VLGHENAGWVAEIGSNVRGVKEGDAVAVMGSWGCGTCARCRHGVDPYCDWPRDAAAPGGGGGLGLDGGMAAWRHGGMAEYMVVRDADRHLVILPPGLEPASAAPLSDAALTPYHAVRRSLPKLTDPRSFALVIGVGGLGGFAVQVLEALTAATVIAVDKRAASRDQALLDGAEHVLDSDDATADAVRDLTGGRGVDVVLDFVGAASTLAMAVSLVRPLSDLTIVGAGGAHASVGFGILPPEVSVQTTFWGSRDELAEVTALYARGALQSRVTTYSLQSVADAYRDLAAGNVHGRAVVVP
jgi:alcohol dehydrogenase, propanol-preferring